MRVLVADTLSAAAVAALAELGLQVIEAPSLTAAQIPAALAEHRPEILVVRSTEVTAAAFEAEGPLGLVIRAGAGVNTIDLPAASRAGVFVANCPGKNSIAVAELTMGLLLAIDRKIPDAIAEARAGRWDKKRFSKADGLAGRRMGLVGFGSIAREVATRARAFGLEVVAWSRSLDDAGAKAAGVVRAASLPELLASCDIVSVHVPYGAATKHLVDSAALARMKPGAILLHTARGGVVDDTALHEAVAAGRIRAGLDVLADEPEAGVAPLPQPLAKLPGCYVMPHVGASTEQAQLAIADEVVRIVRDYVTEGVVPNCVNLRRDRRASSTLVVRHHDRVGVLATVLEALRTEQLNVQQMQNVIFAGEGGTAASATITLAGVPSDALLARLREHADILDVSVRT
jgi:D-3-phosphoglycerate dehydrogenase / 2-oxoglutarate reductase